MCGSLKLMCFLVMSLVLFDKCFRKNVKKNILKDKICWYGRYKLFDNYFLEWMVNLKMMIGIDCVVFKWFGKVNLF